MTKKTEHYGHHSMKPIEDSFKLLLKKTEHRSITLRTILETLKGRGKPLIIVFLTLPFCQPIPLPILSQFFGIAILFLSLRLAFGENVWVPKFMLKQRIPKGILKKVINAALWFVRKIFRLGHPRWIKLCIHPLFNAINGLLLALHALFLAFPLPLPLVNVIAAWNIIILAWGLVKSDGLFVVISYITSASSFLFFIYWIWLRHPHSVQ